MAARTPNSPAKRLPADRRIAEIAERQHGLITRRQLLDLGLGNADVSYRISVGRLHRVHRGVYEVGHALQSADGERHAALLACGPEAFLGARTALAMHGTLADTRWAFDVVVPGRGNAVGPARALVSRMGRVHPDDVVLIRGLRVASLARALVDGTPALTDKGLVRAIKEADYLRIIDVSAVIDAVSRTPNRPQVGRLLQALGADAQLPSCEEFINRYLALCESYQVARPTVDVHMDTGLPSPGQVDLVYADARLIIELDGAQAHMTRHRFEEDRRRDAYLAVRGWLTLRYTWHRITRDAAAVAAEVRTLLDARWQQFR